MLVILTDHNLKQCYLKCFKSLEKYENAAPLLCLSERIIFNPLETGCRLARELVQSGLRHCPAGWTKCVWVLQPSSEKGAGAGA